MKIIDAFWEKRNLGVTCSELIVEDQDTVESLDEALHNNGSEYIVLRLPVQNHFLQFALATRGFVFVEDMLSMRNDLRIPQLNRIQQRLFDACRAEEMDASAFQTMLLEVQAGLFKTDRVSIDPHFSAEQAAMRYCGWLKDEQKRGTRFYQQLYQGKPVGFVTLRDNGNGVFSSVLGAVYRSFQQAGISTTLNYLHFDVAKQIGAKQIVTNVSTNNPAQVRSLLSCGYQIMQIHHIYVRHSIDVNGLF